MSNNPRFDSVDLCDLNCVHGGRGLVEGTRKILQAGAVAWNTLMPGHAPIKPPPSPPRIERVQPGRQTQSGGARGGGQE